MTRRRSTFAIRCWQMLAVAVLFAGLIAAIGITADYAATLGRR